MIQDLRRFSEGTVFETDLCIVGAGPAGIALARAMSGAGLRILLVESGGLALHGPEKSLDVAEIVGLPFTGATEGRNRSLGGAGRLWAGQCRRLDTIDFDRRSWVPSSGWPICSQDLAPYYDAAEQFFQIEGELTDGTAYQQFGLQAPDFAPGTIESMFTVYTPEIDIVRFHHAALKRARDIHVLLHASVTHVDTMDGQASGVQLRTLSGLGAQARAAIVVLCAGGIENARLLLASDGHYPGGLGNARDLVGRFLQDHPNALVATLEAADPEALQTRFRMLYGRRRFFPKFKLSAPAQYESRVLNANAHLVFEEAVDPGITALRAFVGAARRQRLPEHAIRQALRAIGSIGNVGRIGLARVRGRSVATATSAIRLQCHLEQAPDPDCRIKLSAERDAFGMRRAAINWRFGELERATAVHITEQVAGEFGRLGLGRIRPDAWLSEPGADWQKRFADSYHHAGTTRMASCPQNGVVDETLQVFDVAGLYICGGSVFPTSGYANPTLTIVALALRLAERLKVELSSAAQLRAGLGRQAVRA